MFAWESAHPTKVFRKFLATNSTSYLSTAVDLVPILASKLAETDSLVRSYLADGAMQHLRAGRPRAVAQEQFSITIDEPFVDELAGLIM